VCSLPHGRLQACTLCGAVAILCPRCARSRRFCEPCAAIRRRQCVREANARYQASPNGRRRHAQRQTNYRRRQIQSVTDHSSPQAAPLPIPALHEHPTINKPTPTAPIAPIAPTAPIAPSGPIAPAPPSSLVSAAHCEQCRRPLSGLLVPASFARLPRRRRKARPALFRGAG